MAYVRKREGAPDVIVSPFFRSFTFFMLVSFRFLLPSHFSLLLFVLNPLVDYVQMEETRKSGFFGVRDLLCPEVYNHLQLQCPYCPEAAFSFDSFIDNLLVPAPARSLRVNRIKCTDSSVALAEAEQCIGMKGHVHPQFPDILIFPPKEAPEGSSKRCSALNMDFPDTQELAAEDEVRGNPKKVTEDMGAPCRQNNPVMVVVGPQCGQAVLRGAHVYAPGVLAAEPGSRLGSVVSVWAIPRPSKNTPGCAATCMRSLAFLRGAYLHGERRSEVEKWGVFCGRGTLEQSLKDVFLHSKGLAIRMERYAHVGRESRTGLALSAKRKV